MENGKMVVILLLLLMGMILVGGVIAFRHSHVVATPIETALLADPDAIRMVSYSCSGGSVAEHSFFFSLQREGDASLFSCEYFEIEYGSGDSEKHLVEDAKLPVESFTALIQLVANIRFPVERNEADDSIIALDAATYSLTVSYASGKSRSLESHASLSEIERFFRAINIQDEWKIHDK